MNHKVHNQIVSFIWNIADDVLRDKVGGKSKYRDYILPFVVLRRIDALLVTTKEKVLEQNKFMEDHGIDNKQGLTQSSGFPFYNISGFTFADNSPKDANFPYTSLLNAGGNIQANFETYLDGFSANVQKIISRFKVRQNLETMKEAGITYALIEKFASKEINLTPLESINEKGEKIPPLTNHGMGYVFEELIRRFNEDYNEEAGQHFTPREVIKLMTNIIFEPIKDKLPKGKAVSIYDPACGSGGMLTQGEETALKLTQNNIKVQLYGQESDPEIWAVCSSDMLIKGEDADNIYYGSTLSDDGFKGRQFDFMLTNPPYGKSWKQDEDFIVDDRGKKDKENIKDLRFRYGLPSISDGQMLFLSAMVAKMKIHTELGSRIASVHNGSSLFTGDAGSGESEIRRYLLENDLIECIIALPESIFYNTGIPTYIWILANQKPEHRKGQVQLINALNLYEPLRRNLGKKNCELSNDHINQILNIYLDFNRNVECRIENVKCISKIFDNSDFGYHKITVERPLRLKSKFTNPSVESLRFVESIKDEMQWIYEKYGNKVYDDLKQYEKEIIAHFEKEEIKLTPANQKSILKAETWQKQKTLFDAAVILQKEIGEEEFSDFNIFSKKVSKAATDLKLKISAAELKKIMLAVSRKAEEAEPVIKSKTKDKTEYEPDSDLRDTENVPLKEDIQTFFEREVLPYVPDAWIDHDKTVKGYSISFTRYFYNYEAPRNLEDIKAEILQLEKETDGILKEIINS